MKFRMIGAAIALGVAIGLSAFAPVRQAQAQDGLTKLKVAVRGGVVFASFDHDVEPFEEFLGPTILKYFDRVFDGRKLEILGYRRQRIPGNWKLMQENIKDPYHPGLLHTWFSTFGLWRADNKSELKMDDKFRQSNGLIETYTKSNPLLGYVDTRTKMTADDGGPIPAMLLADTLACYR